MVRPNIGTVAGGCWIWDHTAHLPWEVLHSTNYTALPLPKGADLADIVLPTGVGITVREPGRTYDLSYRDGDRVEVDLRFEGVMPPAPLHAGGSTFGNARHYDQIGRVTGRVVLRGESIDIDCLAVRDRTWGRRPEDRPRQAAYVTGVATVDHGFLAVTDRHERVTYGFLRRDSRTVSLVDGSRRVERSPADGWITRIELEATDAEGRMLRAVGEPVSRIIVNRHTFIDINSLVRWQIAVTSAGAGAGGPTSGEAWGEDQDMWPVHQWSANCRERRAG